eukprot:6545256-Pyramimonas_sp.AAC.1
MLHTSAWEPRPIVGPSAPWDARSAPTLGSDVAKTLQHSEITTRALDVAICEGLGARPQRNKIAL